MSTFLGLVSGKQFNDESWNKRSTRRKIFHDYPTGDFPLTGLMSTTETDWTDSSEFGWHEKILMDPETEIAANDGTGAVPFMQSGTATSVGATWSPNKGDVVRMAVDSKTPFRVGQTIIVEDLPTGATSVASLYAIVDSIVSGTSAIEIRVIEDVDGIRNTTNAIDGGTAGPVNAPVAVIGNAAAEGARSTSGIFIPPFKVENYCQIFRNAFSVTGSALKSPTEWDRTGVYKEKAHDNLLRHMIEMEKAFIWGTRSIEYVIEDGEEVPRRTTGGVEWFMREYEKADSVYRGGTGASALAANADDDKRIIRATSTGELTKEFFWKTLMERLFRYRGSKSSEKLCICGSGFISALNENIDNRVTINKNMTAESKFGFYVYSVETPHGIFHLMSHPLFNANPRKRYDAIILDIHDLRFRPLKDRDTKRYRGRQENDQDRRKDEWLTEAGLELRHPQRHMIIKNLQTITTS